MSLAAGGEAEVTKIAVERAVEGSTFTTYNFEVEEFHTYFVGRAGIWVHNTCRPWVEFQDILEHGFGDVSAGDIARAYQRMVQEAGPVLSQAEKDDFIVHLTRNRQDFKDLLENKFPDWHSVSMDNGRFQAAEVFAAARFQLKTGRTLNRNPVITGGNASADFYETLADGTRVYWDAWGPSPSRYLNKPSEWNKLLLSLEDHFVNPLKGNPIIDLAGMPEAKAIRIRFRVQELAQQTGKAFEILEDIIQ